VSHIVEVDLKWLAEQMVETGKDTADIIVEAYTKMFNGAFDQLAAEAEKVGAQRRGAEP
jgi:cystathionine beta-lyase/cystathionine gamma-synthase